MQLSMGKRSPAGYASSSGSHMLRTTEQASIDMAKVYYSAHYYKDLSERMKSRELDMVIAVNMFLTGFDATTLNTLCVDKDLKGHGLIQASIRRMETIRGLSR